jgi:hypothetical protein
MNRRLKIGAAFGAVLAGLFGLTACEPSPYAGPPDAGDVEMETQLGDFIFVPVEEIENIEPGDGGTLVWTVEDSFVVRESPATLRERMRQAQRER